MRERRFLVLPGDYGPDRATIRGEELRHLSRVLRLQVGDPVTVFDGRGRGHLGRIEKLDKEAAGVLLEEAEPPGAEPAVPITLMLGVLHGERMDWAVEKTTELGVSRIVPVLSRRGTVKAGRGGKWERRERWKRIALSAAKQSGRLVVPEITEALPFQELIEREPEPAELRLIFQAGGDEDLPAAAASASASLLVGPEGGWDAGELESAGERGWREIDLGPRTLRAETAAAVAVNLVSRSRR